MPRQQLDIRYGMCRPGGAQAAVITLQSDAEHVHKQNLNQLAKCEDTTVKLLTAAMAVHVLQFLHVDANGLLQYGLLTAVRTAAWQLLTEEE